MYFFLIQKHLHPEIFVQFTLCVVQQVPLYCEYTELLSTYIKRNLCFQAVQEHFKRDTVIVCQNGVEQSLATYILSKNME